MKSKSILLLSGGLDSALNLVLGLRETEFVLAITIDYGQRAASEEISCSRRLCSNYGVAHRVIRLPWLGEISGSALTRKTGKLPSPDPGDTLATSESARAVWVPNRNGLFVNIAAVFAEVLEARFIFVGFNREEAENFSDNSREFMDSLNSSLRYSTMSAVRVRSFTIDLVKRDIVKKASEMGLPFDLIWPCYETGETICGKCESCQRYLRARSEAGL